ncbi:type IVB secretion system protein IcmH/DotU [Alkalimarinus coralli]|uniref:type IVB secretion system protein IcmH/DotU n=1 Tax=Alkalimarinus coralli TaxID=2935863 RepID=UPI00202B13B9|nr:type IVB secretion system protein IcmH/DotU [Alkalimarinus coralli]
METIDRAVGDGGLTHNARSNRISPIAGRDSGATLEILSEKTIVDVDYDSRNQPQDALAPSQIMPLSDGSPLSDDSPLLPDEKTIVISGVRNSDFGHSQQEGETLVSGLSHDACEPFQASAKHMSRGEAQPENYARAESGSNGNLQHHSDIQRRIVNENLLVSSAMPLIHDAMGLCSLDDSADMHDVRARLISAIGRFQNQAEQCVSDQRHVIAARYLLCSFIDEIVATTPWGLSHRWGAESLLSYFHNETYGGDGFFTLLERAKQQPQQYLDLLELMYVCLSLGFSGRYRVDRDGKTKLEAMREEMMTIISKYQAPENRGLVVGEVTVQKPQKKALWWLVLVTTLTVLVGNSVGYLMFSNQIDVRMDSVSDYVLSSIKSKN